MSIHPEIEISYFHIERRSFLKKMAQAGLVAFGIPVLTHCTASNPVSTGSPKLSSTVDLHSHTLDMIEDDVMHEKVKTYNLGGGHTHTITPTAAEMKSLKGGTEVAFTSTANVHTHQVKVKYG
ncbi:MAG: hypothetical protein JNM63_07180 [Spirochaetia bacterium]|nr:hypothetical protein [Spirochaetia bacterium]